MTENTSYYVISTEYVGPNPHEHLDADRIEIHTEPGVTNPYRQENDRG